MSDERPTELALPSFSEDLRALIPDEQRAFDDFEAALADWVPRYRKCRAAARYEEGRFRESGLITARRQGTHLLASAAIRVLDLGAGIVTLINARRAHPTFAAARALVETTASLSYLDQEVKPRLAKGRKAAVETTLGRLRLGLDPGVGFDTEDWDERPIPVSSMIKALKRHADEVLQSDASESAGQTLAGYYSLLSDHAHPNVSAQHLSSVFDADAAMDWVFDYQWDSKSLQELLGLGYVALYLGAVALDEAMQALAKHPLVLEDKRKS